MLSRRAAQRARNHYQPTCNTSSVVCSSVSALSCSDNDFVTFTQEPDDGQPPSCSTYTDDIINGCGVGLSSSRSKLVQWVDDVNDGLCSPVLVGKSSTGMVETDVATPEPILKKMQIVPPPESPQPEYISFNVSNSTGNVTQPPPAINKQCEHLIAIEVEDDTTASLSSQSANDDDSDMTDVTTNNNGLSPKIYAYYTTSPAAIAAKAADDEKRKEREMNQNCFTVFGLVIEPICSGAIFDTKYCGCEPFSKGGEEEEEVVISCVPHWCKDNYTEDGKLVVVSDDEVSQEDNDKDATEDVVKANQIDDEVVVFEDGDMMMLNDIQDLKATTPTEPQEEDVPSVLERDMILDELEVQEAIVVKEEEEPQEEQEADDDESDTPSIWSANSDGDECLTQQVNASPLAAMGAASTIVSSMMGSSPSDEKVDNEDDMMLDVEDGSEAAEELQEEEDVVVEDEDMMLNESQDEKDSSQKIDDNSSIDMSDDDMYEALLEWE